MTTITEITTPLQAVELADRLYSGLGELLMATAGQHLHPDLANHAYLDTHSTPASKLTTRASVGEGSTAPSIVEKDALVGSGSYLRPNGSAYFTRKWGSTDNDDVEVMRTCRANKQYVLLYGEAGCGKTALVEASFPDELYTLLGSGDTELSDFIGGYVQTPSGNFEWIDGPLVKAMAEGKVLLIDEVGLIDPKVLSALYGVMDGRDELIITQNPEREPVKSAEGFYVVGATNPNAFGVRLSEALLSRFTIQVEMTTDWSLAKKLGVPAPAITASQNLAKKQATNEISWSPQFRELLAFRNISKEFGTNWAISNLVAVAPEIDRAVVADVFTRVFGVEVSPAKI